MSFPSPQQERTLLSYLYFWLSARQWWVFVFIGPTQTHSVFGKRCWEISLHTAQSMGNLLHSGRIIAGQRNLLITPRIGWKTTSFWLVSSCWFGSKRLKVKFLLLGREAKTHSKVGTSHRTTLAPSRGLGVKIKSSSRIDSTPKRPLRGHLSGPSIEKKFHLSPHQ